MSRRILKTGGKGMTLEACYARMGGDLGAALRVLESETRLRRYLHRFLDEPTARMLILALEDGRWEDAFRTAHTMKGLCCGLGLTRLYSACSALTEALRDNRPPADRRHGERVRAEYAHVVQAIHALEDDV